MDLIRLNIPYVFVRERCRPSWRGIRFGLQNDLLDPSAPIELAVDLVGALEAPHPALLELAAARAGEYFRDQIDLLAVREPERSNEQLQAEWLYLVLAWTYEHRAEYSDPLQQVEMIHADFGYPPRVAEFVRYMPMNGPDLGSREANERRLFDRWRQYLEECARSPRAASLDESDTAQS